MSLRSLAQGVPFSERSSESIGGCFTPHLYVISTISSVNASLLRDGAEIVWVIVVLRHLPKILVSIAISGI